MKSLLFALLIITSAAHAITVDGFVYLSGQSDHSGTKIAFRAASPSAQTDSTYSDNTGAFVITLQPGVYNVEYSHSGYALYPLPHQALLFATTLPPATLLPPISGALSGTLGPGDFQVVDSIGVDSGQALTLLPGTRLWFEPLTSFVVRGALRARGTDSDSIIFSRRVIAEDTSWNGINVYLASSPCSLSYCVVEQATGIPLSDRPCQGIECYHSWLYLAHSTLRNNQGHYGGGLKVENLDSTMLVTVEDCDIRSNQSSEWGGGIASSEANLVVRRTKFEGNVSDYGGGLNVNLSQANIYDCLFTLNQGIGGAIYNGQSRLSVSGTLFDHNGLDPYGSGGAIYTGGRSDLFDHCVFSRNLAREGGALHVGDDSLQILNCTFVGNVGSAGSALYGTGNHMQIISTVVAFGDTIAHLKNS
jgi:hypothetical protein